MKQRTVAMMLGILMALPWGGAWGASDHDNTLRELQQCLAGQGYAVGPVDGIKGPRTSAALVAWVRDRFGPQWLHVPVDTILDRLIGECPGGPTTSLPMASW
jgi:peptidoglycan hydrolase-like protein with peptidoglycan-binding domain